MHKQIYDLGNRFSGSNPAGDAIGFTNYYMTKNKKPFFGISGEIHFSRSLPERWEDELRKMKQCGINIVSTYVFWIHHEEEEGCFDFDGRKNLRKFLLLCQKLELYVIMRIGPFAHGECRNGGLPDWLYGMPFDVRDLNPGFLAYTKRWYEKIAEQVQGLFFGEGGPIIGVQIDNEYMHSAAPWEMTTGISNEWIGVGTQGNEYMLQLKSLAAEAGILPVFYTCTGWGGAATPEEMLPLWGGYSFRPWLFYDHKGEHPCTDEYIYQDFHNNEAKTEYDFHPFYQPEAFPYACCEMGGGMMCSYNYRFRFDYKCVDAMANIKIASGCNLLGYYMFQGGTNPIGKCGTFMNESQVSRISYDYQAALGEFGQVRESYRRLKTLHLFTAAFQDQLCKMETELPKGAAEIDPYDLQTLRYSVRRDGNSGFLFINNYQDHAVMPPRINEKIEISLEHEKIEFSEISLATDENCILPFHMDLSGIDLVWATAQPVTSQRLNGRDTYVFMQPEGMTSRFCFEAESSINGKSQNEYRCELTEQEMDRFTVEKHGIQIEILCITRQMSNEFYVLKGKGFLFTPEILLEREDGYYLECSTTEPRIRTYPENILKSTGYEQKRVLLEEISARQIGVSRYALQIPDLKSMGIKDAILKISYTGDIGTAFICGKMVHDNFNNGTPWEMSIRDLAAQYDLSNPLVLYITPWKEGVMVDVSSVMAGRAEHAEKQTASIERVWIEPVYEIALQE